MQGRLSPLVDGKIQAFPWNYWKQEFKIANSKAIFSLCKSMLYQTNQKMKQIGLPDQQPDLILEDYFYLDRFLLAYLEANPKKKED